MTNIHLPSTRRVAGLGIAAAAVLGLAIATASPAGASGKSGASAAAGDIVDAGGANAIPGSYIVVFKDAAVRVHGLGNLTNDKAAKSAAKVEHNYVAALRGFAGKMTENAAKRLAADPDVAYVAQNHTVHLFADQGSPPSWGLDRLDQRDLPLNNNYHYDADGSNVTAYVIDTGIRTTHQTFGGRAVWGTNTTGDGNNTDCNGHGTHVAGTIGGAQYGVAKGVQLVAVKVLDCTGSGSFAGVAQGIDWVTAHHVAGAPAVANMSLGAQGTDVTTETAVRNSIAAGVTYAIAAGNSNANACNFTPARVAEAITVDASDSTDARASFSNFGVCTDIFAPGVNITSAWNTSDNATNTISGTSMATPHVTGAAALYLSANPSASPATVQQALKSSATLNHIANPGTGSPNQLLYTVGLATGSPVPVACTAAQKLGNPGFESGATAWSSSPAVIGQNGPSQPAHAGTWDAWLDGYGITHTDTVSQSVTIPAGCTNATLSFWLHVDTAETTTTTVFDRLLVQVGSTTLATYSNLNKASGYAQKAFDVSAFAGQTVTVKFTGTEDSSLQTSFVVDDTALNVS